MKLNKIEKLKLQQKPWEYYQRLDELDGESLTESDRFYLKNFGIYNTKLRSEFMVRIRIPAGRLSRAKLQAIIDVAKRLNAQIIITARSQIELHKLSFQEALDAHRELMQKGISTFATLTDNFRNIVTDVADGMEGIEVYPLIQEIENIVTAPSFLGMIPRKFNTAIVGVPSSTQSFFTNDAFFGYALKDGVEGFNLYLGGKNSHFAQSADIFVQKEDVVELFIAIAKAYQKYGLRQNRTKARLFHLIEEVGIEKFKQKIKEFYPKEWQSSGEFKIRKSRFTRLECYETHFGEITIQELERFLDYEEIRLGVDQNIYLLRQASCIKKEILVCAGERFCIFSLFDTKKEVFNLPIDRIKRAGVRVGYSGCLKGCGRHIAADIGLVGIRTNLFGEVERGVRLYFGGLYSRGILPARLIFWAVPLRKLSALIEVILDIYEASGHSDFEHFSQELKEVDERRLSYLFLHHLLGQKISLEDVPLTIEDDVLRDLEQRAFRR